MSVPSVYRPVDGRLEVRLPFAPGGANYRLLKEALGDRTRSTYEGGSFLVARAHLETLVEFLAERFGSVDVALRGRDAERCGPECYNAKASTSWACVCPCAGRNHGTGRSVQQFVIDGGVNERRFTVTKK